MRLFVTSRRFDLVLLGFTAVAALTWMLPPAVAWALLGLVVVPWVAVFIWGDRRRFQTGLDWAIVCFLVAGALGVWAAYDRTAALGKAGLIVVAVLLYYSIARQPRENQGFVVGGMVGLGMLASLGALLTWVAEVRGAEVGLSAARTDIFAGLMALTVPFALLALLQGVGSHRQLALPLSIGALAALIVGLLASGEHGAWLGAGAGILFTLAVLFTSRETGGRRRLRALYLFGLPVLVALPLAGVWLVAGGWPGIAQSAQVGQRLELIHNATRLAGEFLLTGGGLASFAGLYSRYILLIPALFTTTSHNLYLDLLTEMGATGLVSFMALALGAIGCLRARNGRDSLAEEPGTQLRSAAAGSIVALLVMGLVEDPLFTTGGVGFLLLPFGVAAMGFGGVRPAELERPAAIVHALRRPKLSRRKWTVIGAAVVLLLAVFQRQVLSVGLANVGSVLLAREDLRHWPSSPDVGDGSSDARDLAANLLSRAVVLYPGNVSANYRLGLMAMDAGDYGRALGPLRAAFALDAGHRGIRKALAYNLTWLGALGQARPLFEGIHEASEELGVYAWWWTTQGRTDLAERAAQMSALLQP